MTAQGPTSGRDAAWEEYATLLRQWFDAEPERTGRELFERLQAEHPGVYPNGQLRTLQLRLKGWRREAARRLVFATPTMEPGFGTGAEGRGAMTMRSAPRPVKTPTIP